MKKCFLLVMAPLLPAIALAAVNASDPNSLEITQGFSVINGVTSYTGPTKITGGTLQIGQTTQDASQASIARSSVVSVGNATGGTATLLVYGGLPNNIHVNTTGTLRYFGSATAANALISNAGLVDISQVTTNLFTVSTLTGAGTLYLGNTELIISSTGQFAGTISDNGNGKLTKQGVGTFILSGNNQYSGLTKVVSGTLQLASKDNPNSVINGAAEVDGGIFLVFGSVNGGVAVNGGTLQIGDKSSALGSVRGDSTIAAGGMVNVYGELAGTVNNNGIVTVLGSGNVLDNVTLFNNGGTFDISALNNGAVVTVGSLSDTTAGTIYLGGNNLILQNSSSSTLHSVIKDDGIGSPGSFSYAGSNNLTLTAANTYLGDTTAVSGTLLIGDDLSYHTAKIAGNAVVMNGATMVINGTVGGNLIVQNGGSALLGNATTQAGIVAGSVVISRNASVQINSANSSPLTLISSGSVYFRNQASAENTTVVANRNSLVDISGITHDAIEIESITDAGGSFYLGAKQLVLANGGIFIGSFSDNNLGGSLSFNTGSYTLNSANTYTGLTYLNRASLNIGDFSGAYPMAAVVGGVNLSNSSIAHVYGSLSGNSFIDASSAMQIGDAAYPTIGVLAGTVNNAGSLIFYNNSGAGSSVLNNQTQASQIIFAGSSSSGAAQINNSGTIYYQGNNTADNTAINNTETGVLDISGISNAILTLGHLTGDGTVIVGSKELEVGALHLDAIFTGSINDGTSPSSELLANTGGALTKVGNGTLVLNSVNSYSGMTTVDGGILVIGDSNHPTASVTGATLVNPGGTLEGYGIVGNNLTNDGIVAPGGSNVAGTFTVQGNYIQGPQATYLATIDPNGAVNTLTVTGNASLAGNIGVETDNGFEVNHLYNLLNAATLTNTFTTTLTPTFFDFDITYTDAQVNLVISYDEATLFSAVETANQAHVINTILAAGGTLAINGALAMAENDAQLQRLLDQLSGATFANQQVALAGAGQLFENELAYRLDKDIWCWVDANQNNQLLSCDDRHVWLKLYAGRNEWLNSAAVSGLNSDVYGAAIGSEASLYANTILGAAVSYSDVHDKATGHEIATTNGGLFQGAVYARYDWSRWRVGGEIDYGLTNSISASRKIENTDAGTLRTQAYYNSSLFAAQLRSSYEIALRDSIDVRPTLGVLYQRVSPLSFSEDSKTGFELNIQGDTYQSARTQLGVALNAVFFADIHPILYMAWEHEFADQSASFNGNFEALPEEFYIEGTSVGREAVYMQVGLSVLRWQGVDIAIEYQGRFAKMRNENALGLEIGFL